MGNTVSRRHRPAGPEQLGPYANSPYPPPPVTHQGPHPYGREQYVNNGQFWGGGWAPSPYAPQHPYAPQGGPFPQAPVPSPPPAPAQDMTQTATIRNAVNLKKDTLRLTPLPGQPDKLGVSFKFDASADCCVTVFIAATEEPTRGCALTPSKQPALQPVIYTTAGTRGLGLQFPPANSSGAAPVVDLSLYTPQQLMHVNGTYPLVIRLETIMQDKGQNRDGHTLQELQPGAEQKVWVQSQTTFAVLAKDEDGRWVAKVLKQKIWVEAVSYELQEIYGMEAAAVGRAAAETAEDSEERLCVICLVNDRNTTVLPCRHMCMCHECAQELRKQTSKCPICRNHVESLLHIKMHKDGASKSASKGVSSAQPQPDSVQRSTSSTAGRSAAAKPALVKPGGA